MAWTESRIFSAFLTDVLNNTTAMDLNTDALLEVALFDSTITPAQGVTSANSAYGAGVWSGGHVTDTGTSAPAGWPTLGRPLASVTSDFTTNVYKFDAADTVSANTVTTLTNVCGALIYDHSAGAVTDQGICFIWLGNGNTVTLGQFTCVWAGAGIFTLTL